jgi:outer membrane protein assembly factor BamB
MVTKYSLLFRILLFVMVNQPLFAQLVYEGKVLSNQKPLAGIAVSDGQSVVVSGQDGAYKLTSATKPHFISVTVPDGFTTERFYQSVDSTNNLYNFTLTPVAASKEVTFVHITDTETFEGGTWLENLKAYLRHNKPDFLFHTGDICYEKGLRFHAKELNTQTMGKQVYYSIGNHDLLKGSFGGEWLYQELFGPVMYSFDRGNVHFVVAPMLSGDFKPSYKPSDVVRWLKADLAVIPKGKPVVVFSHDLWSDGTHLELKAEDGSSINFLDYNVKAFVYGHWHNNYVFRIPNGKSYALAIGGSPPDKGGIDHAPSSFQVIRMDEAGNIKMDTRYTYVDSLMTLTAPLPELINHQTGKLRVNAYDARSPFIEIKANVKQQGRLIKTVSLKSVSPWSWESELKLAKPGTYDITLTGRLQNGQSFNQNTSINYQPVSSASKPTTLLASNWTAHAGGEIFMASPIVSRGKVIVATIDDSNLQHCAIIAFDAKTGRESWRFKTDNSIKNNLAVDGEAVLATDAGGTTYALNAQTGHLLWRNASSMKALPNFVTGIHAQQGVVFTGSGKGLKALRAADGSEIWKDGGWVQGQGTTANFSLGAGVLVTSAHWRGLYSNDAQSGRLLWKYETPDLRFRDATPVFQDSLFHVISVNKYFAISPQTGAIVRELTLPFQLHAATTPLIVDNKAIFGTSNGGMVAIDKETGSTLWQVQTGEPLFYTVPYAKKGNAVESAMLRIGNRICFGATDGYFYLVSIEDGQIIRKIFLGAPIFSTPTIADGKIIVADFSGTVHAFSLD